MTSDKNAQPRTTEPLLATYLNRKGIHFGLPISGTFELTSRCNFNCKMCYVHRQDAPEIEAQELTAEQWLSIASEARDMGMMFLLLTGGEPFIRKDFLYFYTELVKMGFLLSINTNASLYNEELRELFNRYPPSRINVTLYGGSEETYRSLCGNASFEKVVHNLRQMKQDGLSVRLNVTLTRYNAKDMQEIDRISREIGLQAKASSYLYPPVRLGDAVGYNAARCSPEEAGEVMAQWNALRDGEEMLRKRAALIRNKRSAELTELCSGDEQEGVRCRAGRSGFWLTWDGRLLPCGTMGIEASYPLSVGFAAAWQEVLARTAAIRLPKECSGCDKRKNCTVCAAVCQSETGRFDGKPEYVCRMMNSMLDTTLKLADALGEEETL